MKVENDKASIIGEIVSNFEFSHKMLDEQFFTAKVLVKRLSGKSDVIPVMVSDYLINSHMDYTGRIVKVDGQFRSYNRHDENARKLVLYLFAQDIQFIDMIIDPSKGNQIELDGYICKVPIYRKTPLGREITDLLLAVNHPYGKSSYIPCITWGRNARYASGLEIGTHLRLSGRIQSREYTKKRSNDQCETLTAYEVSVARLEVADEAED